MTFTSATQHQPNFQTELITPEKAKEYLANQFRNRALRPTKIKDYVRQMKTNKWLVNGEPIIFDKSGRLIDGQHRLNAVIQADTPQTFDVRRNVDAAAAASIDTGASRKMYEQLTIGNMTVNSLQLGAVQNIYSVVVQTPKIDPKTNKCITISRMGSTMFSADAATNRQIVTYNRSLLNIFENAGFLKPGQNKLVTAVGMKLAIYVENQRKLDTNFASLYKEHGITRGLHFVDIAFNGYPELFEPRGAEDSAAYKLFKFLVNMKSQKQSKTVYNQINNAGFNFANRTLIKQIAATAHDPFPLLSTNVDNRLIVDSFVSAGTPEGCSKSISALTLPTYGSV